LSDKQEQMLWPIIIVQDRYRGVYTGGRWVAIGQADYVLDSLDDTVWGDDASCMEWAYRNIDQLKQVGIGGTPDEALEDLLLVAENVERQRKPEEEVARLRGAISTHRAMVMSDPTNTEAAERKLWSMLAPIDDSSKEA
jgi:hypothetical protein